MARNSQERYKRLSSALRENLLKRKEQQRSRELDRHEKEVYTSENLASSEIQEDDIGTGFSEAS